MDMEPTAQHRRILGLMVNGELIWEVLRKSYRSIYNEKRGRDQRVPPAIVDAMEQQGWLRRQPNPESQRLDGWELTEQGREAATQLKTRKRKVSLETKQ